MNNKIDYTRPSVPPIKSWQPFVLNGNDFQHEENDAPRYATEREAMEVALALYKTAWYPKAIVLRHYVHSYWLFEPDMEYVVYEVHRDDYNGVSFLPPRRYKHISGDKFLTQVLAVIGAIALGVAFTVWSINWKRSEPLHGNHPRVEKEAD